MPGIALQDQQLGRAWKVKSGVNFENMFITMDIEDHHQDVTAVLNVFLQYVHLRSLQHMLGTFVDIESPIGQHFHINI
jgi:hypothetical protein